MSAKPKILLVDDEADIVDIIARGLTAHGFDVTVCSTPSQALAYDPSNYDHAVLDIRMPQMTGFELARKLWKKNNALPVCFLSAFEIHADEARKTLPNLASHCFLTKPILPSTLAAHIEKHLAKL